MPPYKRPLDLGRFAVAVNNKLEQKGWSVLRLAQKLDATYEHVRKIAKGLTFPSKLFLKEICRVLGLDFDEMIKLVVADKIEKRYGDIPVELAGKTPRFTKIERLLPALTEEQFQTVVGILQDMDRRNRRLGTKAEVHKQPRQTKLRTGPLKVPRRAG
jgi:transcriptional regulator with XRE-family HTH domain